ncbi:ABC transporter permease [Amycolatopsis sp. YIM 10]|uniref:ABC transporter permease n=1 Tax=Amycolatopsis sp. YIM 10 TaxID=2653857 RepID=UPI00128FDEE1|nr:ABC transporter permease [Amycolatopsis sp. YIM 10]QFU92504.1 Dipeptide transport system permease protein DppB [Amycolatopsis sp. YIM 10]
MTLRVIRKLGRALVVVFLVTISVVALFGLVPGTVATVILGQSATPEAVAALNASLGLNDPLWTRYAHWVGDAVTGDLGTSPLTGRPVLQAILERLPVTAELAVLALLIALICAIPLAILSSLRAGTKTDRTINGLSSVLLSVPTFVAAPVLIYLLALQAELLPVTGWVSFGESPFENLRHALLPAAAIATTEIAAFTRLLRSDLISTLREDYVVAARAKGLPTGYVVLRHALRPSSFSLITVVGVNLGRLIGGTVIVETLFALPGLGQLATTSIMARDVLMVEGIVAFLAVAYVGINTVVDIGYGFLDPRVRGRRT